MTRRKEDQIIFDNKLREFYNILRLDSKTIYYCRKCNEPIKTIHMKHYKSCVGMGVRRGQNRSNPDENKHLYSEYCDMGCGQLSNFYYKSGKAYCCKLGAKCSIKVANDKEKKDGINPWEGKEHPRGMLGKDTWCKGLTKESNKILQQTAAKLSLIRIEYNKTHTFTHSQATKDKMSQIAFAGNYGGYQKGSGWGKKGWYKGYFCDSSWELAYVIYCLDHDIPIKRNLEPRTYTFNGKIRKYFPDFIMYEDTPKQEIIEIKGYETLESKAKSDANPDVKLLFEDDLKDIFKYVKGKYGKKFIELYEKVDTNNKS